MQSNELADFSNWQKWDFSVIERAPKQPAVYIFRSGKNFGRLKGDSDLIYIGCTKRGSLQNRLKSHFKGQGDVSRRLERVGREMGSLEVGWRTHTTGDQAGDNEAQLLSVYDTEHLELPPLNRSESGKLKRELINALLQVRPDYSGRLSAHELTQWVNRLIDEVRRKGKETPSE